MNTSNEKTPEEVSRTAAIHKAVDVAICLFFLCAIALALVGCTPKREAVATYWGNTPNQAAIASRLHAAEVGGVAYYVLPTGSMEPFLKGGDNIVVKPIPYEDIRVGMMANYKARWLPSDSPTVTHWVGAKQGEEWIMDGQANKHYESAPSQLMGRKEFKGIVVAIYTTRENP